MAYLEYKEVGDGNRSSWAMSMAMLFACTAVGLVLWPVCYRLQGSLDWHWPYALCYPIASYLLESQIITSDSLAIYIWFAGPLQFVGYGIVAFVDRKHRILQVMLALAMVHIILAMIAIGRLYCARHSSQQPPQSPSDVPSIAPSDRSINIAHMADMR